MVALLPSRYCELSAISAESVPPAGTSKSTTSVRHFCGRTDFTGAAVSWERSRCYHTGSPLGRVRTNGCLSLSNFPIPKSRAFR